MGTRGWTPAALVAALKGDFDNALVAMTPGGIEAQEAHGQHEFVYSDTMPIKCGNASREQLEALGFSFGEQIDELFVQASLPEGWSKRPTDHSLWTDLLDDNGRIRGKIGYKAAFYDRWTIWDLSCRYSYHADPVRGWEDPEYDLGPWQGVITDQDKVIWATPTQLAPQPHNAEREVLREWYDKRDRLAREALECIERQFPDYQNPFAYWDE